MMSFRKRTVQKPIRGTRTSPHTAQVITSSGNPSLDEILGGGLPIGSICLIEEDRFMTHAKVLAKYFLAEGVESNQEIFLGSLDDLPAEVLRRLPKPLTDEEVEQDLRQDQQANKQPADKNGLRIAFRYNDLPLVNSEQTTAKIGHHFNLMEHMDSLMLYFTKITVWDDSHKELEPKEDDPSYKVSDVVVHNDDLISSSKSLDSEPLPPPVDGIADVLPPAPAAVQVPAEADSDITAVNNNNNNNNNNVAMNSSTAYNTISSTTITPTSTTATTTATTTSPEAQPPSVESQFFYNPRYGRLLNKLKQLLQDEGCVSGMSGQKNLYRICLTSLGSPLWYDDNFASDLLKFLTVLRACVRNCTSVCFITMPMHLIAKYDTSLVPKIRQLVDYAIELESFAGSDRETHPAFKEYSGLLHLHKMTALNTLAVHMPETTDLAFKLRRKKFVIEKMHLPPDLQEISEKTAAGDILGTPNCSSGVSINSNISMDF
ncbi:elongator complex protein 4 [Drosophila nasuta]|uniref:Elongator complex protein 4 n=1 Tax=Drosophila albomicans TaxID=7291 RepID=A0A6P8X6K3_DROAB|nr:elongator complex protein 4 [Drosophila albomicans]XP_060654640.1 elongator complex protein 4 [Drosophila nasuta]